MPAFAVKHIEKDHGLLSRLMKDIKKTPYSYTSKDYEAKLAAQGNFIYVIEVRKQKATRTYWLGYKYRAYESFQLASGALWKGEFKYKNSATPLSNPEGLYFTEPLQIIEPIVCSWLREQQFGMAEIPSGMVDLLDETFKNNSHGTKQFV